MPLVSIPDDSPAVLATSVAFPVLRSFATVDYHDTLPGSEDALILRIGSQLFRKTVLKSGPRTRWWRRNGRAAKPA